MLFVTRWTCPQQNLEAEINRFRESGDAPPLTGVKMSAAGTA